MRPPETSPTPAATAVANAAANSTVSTLTWDVHHFLRCSTECIGMGVDHGSPVAGRIPGVQVCHRSLSGDEDRKSTRLNSSHVKISYAVFCLKKNIKICI